MKCLRVAVAWLLVGIPLGWGVARSVQKALPLFGVVRPPLRAPATNAVPSVPAVDKPGR